MPDTATVGLPRNAPALSIPKMASHIRVLNTFDGSRPKLSRAMRLIDLHLYAWVEGKEGAEIRKLSLRESLQAQSEQKRLKEPLPYAEILGLHFEAPSGAVHDEKRLIWEASVFAAQAIKGETKNGICQSFKSSQHLQR